MIGIGRNWEELRGNRRNWEELGGIRRHWKELEGFERNWKELGFWKNLNGILLSDEHNTCLHKKGFQ